MSVLIASLAIFNLVIPTRLSDMAFAFLLLYYYSTLVLREHILVVNGSKLKPWVRIFQKGKCLVSR